MSIDNLSDVHIAVVTSRFNHWITDRMLDIATKELYKLGMYQENVYIARVPGAFELPFLAKILITQRQVDCVLLLGAVIQGETAHFEHISRAVADGAMRLSIDYSTPIIFGVLTTYNLEQADARVEHAKIYAKNALEMAKLKRYKVL